VDVFYVQDEWGEKIVEKQKLEHLKKTFLDQLTPKREPSHLNIEII
jgi:hypothetical protein